MARSGNWMRAHLGVEGAPKVLPAVELLDVLLGLLADGMPGGSKTWIWITSGSQLEMRTWMPPWALPPLTSKRLTALPS